MAFHRFVIRFKVTVAAPGASNEPPNAAADQELIDSLTKSLTAATKGKVKGTSKNKEYTVETVEQA